MALFYSSVSVIHDSVTESQHARYQNSVIINLIIYTCAFPGMTCKNVLCEKGLLPEFIQAVLSNQKHNILTPVHLFILFHSLL